VAGNSGLACGAGYITRIEKPPGNPRMSVRLRFAPSPKSLELIREWQEVLSRRNDDLSDDMFGAQVTDSEWYSADADDAEDDKEPLVATGLARADSSLNGSFF
jgi:hypothetical protein